MGAQFFKRMKTLKIGIIGSGVLGGALGYCLKQKGAELTGISGRNAAKVQKSARFIGLPALDLEELVVQSRQIFLTVPDSAIAGLAEQIAGLPVNGRHKVLIHTSGALPAREMAAAYLRGYALLSLHPLQSFADLELAVKNLPGSYLALEGDEEALVYGEKIGELLGGKLLRLASQEKVFYHLAGVMASNYWVTLVGVAGKLMERAGIPEEEGIKALRPIMQGTLHNLLHLSPAQALTGPIARGDCETVIRHQEALQERCPEFLNLYRELKNHTIELARKKGGLNEKTIRALSED